jgi:hypothetical protein
MIVAGLIAVSGIWYVLDNQRSQVGYRETVIDIRTMFPEIGKTIALEGDNYTSFDRYWSIVVPLIAVQIAGFVVLGCVISPCRTWFIWLPWIGLAVFAWMTYCHLRQDCQSKHCCREHRRRFIAR